MDGWSWAQFGVCNTTVQLDFACIRPFQGEGEGEGVVSFPPCLDGLDGCWFCASCLLPAFVAAHPLSMIVRCAALHCTVLSEARGIVVLGSSSSTHVNWNIWNTNVVVVRSHWRIEGLTCPGLVGSCIDLHPLRSASRAADHPDAPDDATHDLGAVVSTKE
jgi:hypothetical protein